jgi:hypothetical protein
MVKGVCQLKGEATIKISPDGSTTEVDAENFTGEACLESLGGVLDAVGGGPDKLEKKPEFFDQEHQAIKA